MAIKKQIEKINYKTIAPFLLQGKNKAARWFGYIGLGIGLFILLASLQLFLDINALLTEKSIRKDGFDFISVTKTITNENMGKDNRFSVADIKELKDQNFITDAAPLLSNQFRAKASAGNIIPFSTDLFLESIDNNFLDTLPPDFTWQPGQQVIPVIFSSDYLEMYNIFAPTQGLPQLSAATASSVNIILECYGPTGPVNYKARIVGLSDRINSILVPKAFLEWANSQYGNETETGAARVYIKTVDANNPQYLNFLQQKNYHINKDKTKFGRVKKVLQAVVSGMGVFAILVILLSLFLFSIYLQLMIARSKNNLQLLITLGYSPHWLSKQVAWQWIPVYAIIFILVLVLVQISQYLFSSLLPDASNLNVFISPWVALLALVFFAGSLFLNFRFIKKAVLKI